MTKLRDIKSTLVAEDRIIAVQKSIWGCAYGRTHEHLPALEVFFEHHTLVLRYYGPDELEADYGMIGGPYANVTVGHGGV